MVFELCHFQHHIQLNFQKNPEGSLNQMENQESKQKEIFEFNMLDMQLRQMEQQAIMLEQQILEFQTVIFNLDELKKAKKGQNVLFPMGRDIFAEGKMENSDSLFINIGSKTIVKKNVDETKKIVEKQKETLIGACEEIKSDMEKVFSRILELEKRLSS
jgi:prefoldin alpha subunit